MSETKLLVKSGKTGKETAMTQKTLDDVRRLNPTAEYTVINENVKPAEAQQAEGRTPRNQRAVAGSSTDAATATDAAKTE